MAKKPTFISWEEQEFAAVVFGGNDAEREGKRKKKRGKKERKRKKKKEKERKERNDLRTFSLFYSLLSFQSC